MYNSLFTIHNLIFITHSLPCTMHLLSFIFFARLNVHSAISAILNSQREVLILRWYILVAHFGHSEIRECFRLLEPIWSLVPRFANIRMRQCYVATCISSYVVNGTDVMILDWLDFVRNQMHSI